MKNYTPKNERHEYSSKAFTVHSRSETNAEPVDTDEDTSGWRVLYRHSEFWLTSLIVCIPAVWLTGLFENDESWVGDWVPPIISAVAGLLILGISALAIERRQALIEAGKVPWTLHLEALARSRFASACIAVFIIWGLFTRPIWTMPGNIHVLQVGYTVPKLIPALGVIAVLTLVGMVLIKPVSRLNKIIRACLATSAIGLSLYANFFIGYGGEDSAPANELDITLFVGIPLAVAVWYIVDCFRTPRRTE